MKITKSIVFCFVCLISFSAQAANLVLEGGIHAGGDAMVTVISTDETIYAGDGTSLAIGTRFDLSESMEMAITYGVKIAVISTSDGNVDWTRYPLNAIFLYKADDWRFGGGLTYHSSPALNIDGLGTINFDDALGALIDVRYFFGESAYVGGRATFIDYTVQNSSVSVNGNSIGVILGVNL